MPRGSGVISLADTLRIEDVRCNDELGGGILRGLILIGDVNARFDGSSAGSRARRLSMVSTSFCTDEDGRGANGSGALLYNPPS